LSSEPRTDTRIPMRQSSRHTVTLFVFSACAGVCVLLGFSCGPRPPAETHWEFLNGPYARNVSAFLPSRTNGDFLFAGLTNGSLFSSTNGGRTWLQRTSPAPGFTIHQFVEEPEPGSLLYAATDAGLFLSPDSARSWKHLSIIAPPATPQGVLTLAIDPWKPALLYAGSRGHGIFRSTDRGTTWQPAQDSGGGPLAEADIQTIMIDSGRLRPPDHAEFFSPKMAEPNGNPLPEDPPPPVRQPYAFCCLLMMGATSSSVLMREACIVRTLREPPGAPCVRQLQAATFVR
jgi:hypothetical protein